MHGVPADRSATQVALDRPRAQRVLSADPVAVDLLKGVVAQGNLRLGAGDVDAVTADRPAAQVAFDRPRTQHIGCVQRAAINRWCLLLTITREVTKGVVA